MKNDAMSWGADCFKVGDSALVDTEWRLVVKVNRASLVVIRFLGDRRANVTWNRVYGRSRYGVHISGPAQARQADRGE